MSVCHREPAVQSSGDEDVASRSSLRARGGVECCLLGKARRGYVAKTELAVIDLARKIRRFGFRRKMPVSRAAPVHLDCTSLPSPLQKDSPTAMGQRRLI